MILKYDLIKMLRFSNMNLFNQKIFKHKTFWIKRIKAFLNMNIFYWWNSNFHSNSILFNLNTILIQIPHFQSCFELGYNDTVRIYAFYIVLFCIVFIHTVLRVFILYCVYSIYFIFYIMFMHSVLNLFMPYYVCSD